MSRKRQLQVGAINVTMPAPHRPERYIDLFQKAGALEKVVKLRGDWVGRLGSMKVEADSDGQQVVRGEFYKYIELDSTRDWFNVAKGKPAEAGEMDSISIPEDLKPHFQYVPFIFFSKGHRLVMITKDGNDVVSSAQAAIVLKSIFQSEELATTFGKIEVVVEPSRDTLDKILKMPRLRRLEIIVTPPNPDDFEEYEKELFEDMSIQHAGIYQLTLHEADVSGLLPGEKIRKLAKVAQSNGKVSGVGGGRGKSIHMSTTDHPLTDTIQFDPVLELRTNVLFMKAKEIIKQIRG